MEQAIPYGDIIVIAAIAAFIILRYRATLGQNSGFDVKRDAQEKRNEQNQPKVLDIPVAKPVHRPQEAKPSTDLAKEFEAYEGDYKKMMALDPSFSFEGFLSGAKAAFEMVLKGFNEKDVKTLKMLLAKDVFDDFKEAIDAQKEKGLTQETTLVGIHSADVTDVQMKKSKAEITVQFSSEQINVIKNDDDEVVEGDKSRIVTVEDEWTFERDLSSQNPNWTIVNT